ncbi:MAG: glycosyltransferase [Flavobacteriaceae bacterium]|nr:glycosyltransferase [Flavobacteriaceae bacterium]
MKFAIITHVEHKKKAQDIFAYEPYVREMNLWLKYVDQVQVVAPFSSEKPTSIDIAYVHGKIAQKTILQFDITTISNALKSIFLIPIISFKIFKTMLWADHIHLRCPGNVGLLGCFIQILFPNKPKTVKYAGNWDPNSKQPFSYRLQKKILSSTFLTKNCKVLVYGKWENQSKNIIPFFTATYSKNDIKEIPKKDFSEKTHFIFVGALSVGKQPITSVKIVHALKSKGYDVQLDMYGEGLEREVLEDYIRGNDLENEVFLHGNVIKEEVKKAFQKSHFLVFISKSEGWPKVVAEAMFWSCLPITTSISCVPYMIANGKRGALVKADKQQIINEIEIYLNNEKRYQNQVSNAKDWSQEFTLEKFESEIKKLLKN